MIEDGLNIDRSIEVHEESLYLCGILIQKKIKLDRLELKNLKVMLNTL